jgi:putative ABC transport system substrate-binding protein
VVAADAKRLELLREVVPSAGQIAHLINPTSANNVRQIRDVDAAARTLNVELTVLKASKIREFAEVFSTIVQQRLPALNIAPDPFFFTARDELIALAQQHAVPTMYFFREFVTAGGLISFGSRLSDAYRQVGVYTGRILKGAKPADLPIVQQSEQLELVINEHREGTRPHRAAIACRAR